MQVHFAHLSSYPISSPAKEARRMRAAVYIRVSTDEQTEYSPKSQQEMIARYAASHAIELSDAHTYIDEGISGRSAARRPAFQKMLADARIKPRPFDLVLVWKFSRFARSRRDSIVCKAMLKQCGIEVVSVSEPIGHDSTAVLMEALLEAMDEYYSLNLAQEVKRGMEQKFREGGVVSRPPFGYRMREGAFVPEEREASAVKLLFEGAAAGRSLRSMADALEQSGIFRADGSLLTARAIAYILQNPIYCGKAGRTLDGEWVVLPADQPPIVSQALFEQVQPRFGGRDRSGKRTVEKAEESEWMLRGIVRCSDCGRRLAGAGKGSLQCSGYARGLCKVSHWVGNGALSMAVIQALGGLDSPTVRVSPDALDGRQSNEIKRIDEALSRAERAYLAGVTDLTEYAAQKEELLARRTERTVSDLPSFDLNARSIASFLQNDRFSAAEKRQLVGRLFEGADFDRRAGTLRIKWKTKNSE